MIKEYPIRRVLSHDNTFLTFVKLYIPHGYGVVGVQHPTKKVVKCSKY